nr:hypothetical protein ICEMyc226_00231 [Mycolicibacterium sp.]
MNELESPGFSRGEEVKIRCTVTNPGPPPLMPLLAENDEAVERALTMTNALYEAGQGTLAERLVQLRSDNRKR